MEFYKPTRVIFKLFNTLKWTIHNKWRIYKYVLKSLEIQVNVGLTWLFTGKIDCLFEQNIKKIQKRKYSSSSSDNNIQTFFDIKFQTVKSFNRSNWIVIMNVFRYCSIRILFNDTSDFISDSLMIDRFNFVCKIWVNVFY